MLTLTFPLVPQLAVGLPPHWTSCTFSLVYSTARDGFSLSTLYRKVRYVQGGQLLLIRDTLGGVFGAVMSERMHCSPHFYGTGESCVFHWKPDFQVRFRCVY
ncbi:unnamed protein product [Protopolystoma xenopodis]|uniref:Oxidation resistance protein 1 n=1 Tax=Protopolystoma xenopodis TaxID=117903 RepID=A0A448XML9_9PLAT|nr:unnamed protein product [Protopolystoma xenopodis]